ncbi:MAG: amidase [Betaproteobacteria bacterium]|nr:amidase [Betaproteobacteria bacterium]
MTTDKIHYLELHELARSIHARKLSPVEVTGAMLERISAIDPMLHAYVNVMGDEAMAGANLAEKEISRGLIRGHLHGVPIAIKDIFGIKGSPTAAGMSIHRSSVAEVNATVVNRLIGAGAVLLGKLTLTEGVYAEHRPPFIAPTNPWNARYWPGASSSGSGVSVASGLSFAALASETGGSIKLPSAANGITSIKPTWGRVSRFGVFELAASLDHVGAMARSAADVAVMLSVIAGADPLDPTASQMPVPDYVAALDRGVRGLRIGLDPAWTHTSVDANTSDALDAAIDVLCRLGAEVKPVTLPDPAEMILDWFGVCAVQAALAHEKTYPRLEAEYGPALSGLLKMGHSMTGTDYQRLLIRRENFRGRMSAALGQVDMVALPVLSLPTPTLERMGRMDDELIAGLHRFTCPFNMSGHPGIVLPCGFSGEKMPIAFQLVGAHYSESALLASAHAYQKATDWHRVHPALYG